MTDRVAPPHSPALESPCRFFAPSLLLPAVAHSLPNSQTASAQTRNVAPVGHTFVYVADRPLKSVCLAGSFNGWNKDKNPMRADADGRTWRLTLPLAFGEYTYKFVLDGATWMLDAKAEAVSDGNGSMNSVLILQPDDYATPARPDDGVIAQSALLHGTDVSFVNFDRGQLILSLRARPDDLSAVTLLADGKRIAAQPTPVAPNDLYTRWVARLRWDRRSDLSYTFELIDGSRTASFGADGLASAGATARPFALSAATFQPFVVPAWVEKICHLPDLPRPIRRWRQGE